MIVHWDIRTGKAIDNYKGHEGAIIQFDVSLDDKFLVSAGDDHACLVFNLT